MEDPSLDRALSPTGLTTSEEFQAQQIDATTALLYAFMHANFEEPKGGWPELTTVTRPRDVEKKKKQKPKEKPQMASAAEIVQFTEEDRETRPGY